MSDTKSAGERDAHRHRPDCAGWEDCECFPTAAERRALAAESRLAEITREREGVVDGLDEFAPHNTGLSLPESVALLRTRLSEVRAEIEGKGGWRERLAEITRALRGMLGAYEALIDAQGLDHEDGCPEDDTCDCPLAVKCREAEAAARALLSSGAGEGRE